MDGAEAIQILTLVNALEPPVINAIKAMMQHGQGKTAEEYFAEADDIWAQIKANAQKELGG